MITRHARVLVCRSLICLISLAALASGARAAVMVGLLLDPPTTAGGGATSTRSGAGTWHAYALDNSSFGIASYDVTLTGSTSNSNRSPVTNVLDHNGDPQTAGFSLRSVANSNPFFGGPSSTSPFQIKGMGQEASDFVTKTMAIDPGSTVVGPTVSGSWGVYSSPAVAPLNGRNWLFLAEGTYNVGNRPTISTASMYVYSSQANSMAVPATFVIVNLPEPAAIGLIGLGTIAGFSLIRRRRAATFFVSLLLAAAIGQGPANAAVIVNVLLDPPTTAGRGVTSTRSGPNTWHLYAVDDNTGDFGISSYDIQMTNVTAVNHRSPLTTIIDHNGDPQPAGFTLLRTATNANPIQASQSLPGTTPFLLRGYGQTASDFATKATAVDPLSSVAGPTISGTWGTYNTIAPYNGKNWVFIAEGTYNAGIRPTISSASITVYKSATSFGSITSPVTIIPEPATLALLAVAGLGALGLIRRRRAAIGFRNSFPNAARRLGVLLACLASLVAFAGTADAAVIFNLLVNPATTAGPGVTSTRSGSGSWQLYAVDDNANDFGISSYSVAMANTTAINHRSPVTTVNDANGDPWSAGFNLLRTATNRNPIEAAQDLPGQTPFLISGFGQTASNFVIKATAIDPGAVVTGPTTSGTWGTYSNGVVPYNGKNWLFLAEGLYNVSGSLPRVTAATVTVYNADFSSKASAVIIPEPTSISLVGLALVGLIGFTRRRPLPRRGIIRVDSAAAPIGFVEQRESMFTTRTAHRAGTFLASLLLAAVLGGSTAQAGVIVGLILNPSSTAGGGATSTRSGPSSWQMYAIDDGNDFGISSYNIAMSGTTALNHRSPVTTINDGNGNPQTAGFNLLRTGTNVNPIQGSQGIPGSTPFQITGFGQTASDFTTKATVIDPAAVVVGLTTSGVWGNYNSPALTVGGPSGSGYTAAAQAVAAGKKWVFLAEGLGYDPKITSAVVTIFSNQSYASSATTVSTICLCELDSAPPPTVSSTTINNVNANVPGSVAYTFSADQAVTWGGFSFVSGPSPAVPATFDSDRHNFNWNPIGSAIGSYKWSVRASNFNGTGTGFVTVNITVPEPAAPPLFTLAIAAIVGAVRLRRI